jgi:hypothetical protein
VELISYSSAIDIMGSNKTAVSEVNEELKERTQ